MQSIITAGMTSAQYIVAANIGMNFYNIENYGAVGDDNSDITGTVTKNNSGLYYITDKTES